MAFVEKNTSNRLGSNQVIAYDGNVTTSTAFTGQTQQARIVASTLSHYKIVVSGSAASTSDPMIPANWVEYVNVRPGEYVAFIKASGGTAGVATVTECS
jgi:hypothetical protein